MGRPLPASTAKREEACGSGGTYGRGLFPTTYACLWLRSKKPIITTWLPLWQKLSLCLLENDNYFMKKILLILSLIVLSGIISAQSISKQANQAQQDINRRGEVYFSFQLNDLSQLSALTKEISISNLKGNTVFAYANQKEFSGFWK